MFPPTWHGDMDLSRGLTPGTSVWISGDPGWYTCHCSPTVHHPLGAVCPEIAIGGTAWRRPWHLSTLKRGVRRDVASSAADPQDVKSVGIWRDVKDYITSTLLFWPSFGSYDLFGVAWLPSPTLLVAKLVSRTAAGSSMESPCLTSRCAVVVFSLDVYPKNMGYNGETFVWCPMKLQGAQGHPWVTGTVILHTKRNTLVLKKNDRFQPSGYFALATVRWTHSGSTRLTICCLVLGLRQKAEHENSKVDSKYITNITTEDQIGHTHYPLVN